MEPGQRRRGAAARQAAALAASAAAAGAGAAQHSAGAAASRAQRPRSPADCQRHGWVACMCVGGGGGRSWRGSPGRVMRASCTCDWGGHPACMHRLKHASPPPCASPQPAATSTSPRSRSTTSCSARRSRHRAAARARCRSRAPGAGCWTSSQPPMACAPTRRRCAEWGEGGQAGAGATGPAAPLHGRHPDAGPVRATRERPPSPHLPARRPFPRSPRS